MMNDALSAARCPLCEAASRFMFAKDGWRVRRCNACRFIFVWPQPTPEELEPVYTASYYYNEGRAGAPGYANYAVEHPSWKWVLEELAKARRPGRLLDVGCAEGYFIEEARSLGWDACGVDLSVDAVERARAKGLAVTVCDVGRELPFEAGSFDAVAMWDVIEHVTDVHGVLDRVLRLLRPDGVLLLNTPNVGCWSARAALQEWNNMKPPEHLSYFDSVTLAALLGRHGMRVQRRWSRAARLPMLVERLLARTYRVRGAAVRAVEVLGLGDALVVIGTRAGTASL